LGLETTNLLDDERNAGVVVLLAVYTMQPSISTLGTSFEREKALSNQPVIFKYIFFKKIKNKIVALSLSLTANKYVSSGLGL
jgi:hypothetical protein